MQRPPGAFAKHVWPLRVRQDSKPPECACCLPSLKGVLEFLSPRNNGGRERPQRQATPGKRCAPLSPVQCVRPPHFMPASLAAGRKAQDAAEYTLRLPLQGSARGRKRFCTFIAPDGVYVGPGRFCAGKSRFPEQKSFLCSFRARKSAGFQRKPVRLSENSRFYRLIAQQKPDLAGFMCVRYRKIVRKVVFGRPVAEMAGDAKSFISCSFAKGETQSADKVCKRENCPDKKWTVPCSTDREIKGLS